MLIEMGQVYKQDWYLHLPWVLLSRRVALQPEVGTSTAKMLLGVDPVVPGQLVGHENPLMSNNDLKGLVKHLEAATDVPGREMTNHSKKKEEFMPITTENATHVYLKQENPTGLLPKFTGPMKL